MIPARKYRLRILLGCGCVLYFFANIERVAIPGAIFDDLQNSFDFSAPQVTALGSSFMYIYALVQLPVGFLVARYGGRRVIAAGALLFCLGALSFPLADSFFTLCLSRGLTGLGAGSVYLALISETLRAFRRNYAVMVSLVIMTGYAGGIVANAPFAAGASVLGWQTLLLLIGLLLFLAWVAFTVVSLTLKFPPIRREVAAAHFGRLLRDRHNRTVFLFGGINFGLYYVLQTVIGKKFLEDFGGIAPENAGWILSLMGAVSAMAGVAFAMLSRFAGNRRRIFCRMTGVISFSAFLLLTLSVLSGNKGWIPLLFCLLAFIASNSSILIPLLHETNPAGVTDQAVSLMNFSFYFFVALFGNMTGFLLELFPPEILDGRMIYSRSSYLVFFCACAFLSFLVLVFSFRIRETMGNRVFR